MGYHCAATESEVKRKWGNQTVWHLENELPAFLWFGASNEHPQPHKQSGPSRTGAPKPPPILTNHADGTR